MPSAQANAKTSVMCARSAAETGTDEPSGSCDERGDRGRQEMRRSRALTWGLRGEGRGVAPALYGCGRRVALVGLAASKRALVPAEGVVGGENCTACCEGVVDREL